MEYQSRPGFDGTDRMPANRGNAVIKAIELPGLILRVVAIVLTFIATILMGVAKQSKTVLVYVPLLGTTGTAFLSAKTSYSSALVYFTVINALTFVYSSVSLALLIVNRTGSATLELVFYVADLVTLVLLLSSNSAAAAVSAIAKGGIPHFGWGKTCDQLDKFCANVTASIVLSMFAFLAYFLLILLAIIGLHKRAQ